jgi:hypothetical protein
VGLYRINHANSVFPGSVGRQFSALEGPMLTAAVLAGAVSRIDRPPLEDQRPAPGPVDGPEPVSELDKQPEEAAEATESVDGSEPNPKNGDKTKKGK